MAVIGMKTEPGWPAAGLYADYHMPGTPQRALAFVGRPEESLTTPTGGGKWEDGGRSGRERVCAVCGDKASGSHYRVVSCEGCKGFWRRTVQRDAASSYTCKGGAQDCPVTVETRGKCQKCR
jgi:hypothetical protein